MNCDVEHVHFCVTGLVKLRGLAVVSTILIHPKEERVWGFAGVVVFFVGVFVVVASPQNEKSFMR